MDRGEMDGCSDYSLADQSTENVVKWWPRRCQTVHLVLPPGVSWWQRRVTVLSVVLV